MKKYVYLAACVSILLSSCSQYDKFTGLWNKDRSKEYDAAAFPLWATKGVLLADTTKMATPLFLRIKKEMGYYVLRCYQLDGAQGKVVAENTIFDFIKFKKTDESSLLSDNQASKIPADRQIILHVDEAGKLTMRFPLDEKDKPTEKRARALFLTLFSSGFRKVDEIRRKTDDPSLIDEKLREAKFINGE